MPGVIHASAGHILQGENIGRLTILKDKHAADTKELPHLLDDLENRGRRNNLLSFGFTDSDDVAKNKPENKATASITKSLRLPVDSSAPNCMHRLG